MSIALQVLGYVLMSEEQLLMSPSTDVMLNRPGCYQQVLIVVVVVVVVVVTVVVVVVAVEAAVVEK